jgi:hypothetical protein
MPESAPDLSVLNIGQRYAIRGIARDALGAANVMLADDALEALYRPNIAGAARQYFAVDSAGEVTRTNVVLQARNQIATLIGEYLAVPEV